MSKTHYDGINETFNCYHCQRKKSDDVCKKYNTVTGHHFSGKIKFYYEQVTVCLECLPKIKESDMKYKKEAFEESKESSIGIIY